MALFVDGAACSIEDLTDQDSGLLDVAKTCGINATTKIRLAHEEIAGELHLWLDRARPALDLVWAPAARLEQVVTTEALRKWEIPLALSLFYRDAYFSQLVDRYQAKWEEYSSLTRRAYERFVASGLGLVNDPVGRAAPPLLASVAGPQKGGTFYASVAWMNGSGQEGSPFPALLHRHCGRQSDDSLGGGSAGAGFRVQCLRWIEPGGSVPAEQHDPSAGRCVYFCPGGGGAGQSAG